MMWFLEPMEVMMLANRCRVPPYGLSGVSSGAVGRNWLALEPIGWGTAEHWLRMQKLRACL